MRLHRLAVTLPLLAVAGCATVGEGPADPYEAAAVEHGRVVAAEAVQRPSAAPGGALMGGLLGLALSGDSPFEKLFGLAAGATAGGALTAAAEGPTRGVAYTVELPGDRRVRVITEPLDLRPGDCVAVETARYTNLRRVSSALCEPPPAAGADPELQARSQRAAEQCDVAKDELLRARTRDEVEVAVRKVRVLCED